MKRIIFAIFVAVSLAFVIPSCQKAPFLTVNGQKSFTFKDAGGSQTFTFSANRDWKVTPSDSWVRVSPSSGSASDGEVTVTITCEPNTTYDPRNTTLTVTIEELMETISISQDTNYGIVIPTKSYDLTSAANTIEVEVQANVQYTVSVSDSWVMQTGTKGLTKNTLVFSVSENTTYDNRNASITIKSQNNAVADQVITVRQAQKDALIVKDTNFNLPYGGGGVEIKVEANVSFDVTPNVEWIHFVGTKALSNSTVSLTVDENPTYSAREGKVEIKQKNGTISHSVTVKQAGRIAVTSVTLDKTSLSLNAGDSETLTATVKPTNATDKTVTWFSSDESVATVDNAGKVTAIKEGTASIIAQSGEKTAECKVSVYVAVTSVELSNNELTLIEGDSETLTVLVKPDNATDKTVVWTSSNEKIATVEKGKVTAVKVGEVTITAKVGDKTAECKVLVIPVPVSSVSLNQASLDLVIGQQTTLIATVLPDNAADKTVTWSSSNEAVAAVDLNGVVTGVGEGEATITAKAGDIIAECLVTVSSIPVSSIELNQTSLTLLLGEQAVLTATVQPDNATDKTVTWTSSNNSVATVENGVVKGVGPGSVMITASAGDQSATCSVIVIKDSADGVSAKYYGGAMSIINGKIQSGSQLNFGIVNYSTETIRVVSVQLIDGQTGSGGNVMSIGTDIASGSSSAWTLTIGAAGIYEPKARFVYTFKGETYTCEAKYTAPNWGF